MSKILITGGAGFIGSHVGRELLRRGEEVVLLDDFNDRYDPTLKEARIQHMFVGVPTPTVIRADIRDYPQLIQIFAAQHFDQVIHLAAWASVQPSMKNPQVYTAVNVDGTVNVLEASRKHGIKNVVTASSSSVYGGIKEIPFREDMNILHPLSPYAATKVATEVMASTWHAMYELPITCLRFFTVYGPWGRPEMAIFKFTRAILQGQAVEMRGRTTMRDFTYIDDIVQGVIGALDHPQGYRVYNLGESDGVLLPRLLTALETALGRRADIREVPLPPTDIPRTLADISAAQREIGYSPHVPIEVGVARFVDWYVEWYLPNFAQAVSAAPISA